MVYGGDKQHGPEDRKAKVGAAVEPWRSSDPAALPELIELTRGGVSL